jgi:hypothetical protein
MKNIQRWQGKLLNKAVAAIRAVPAGEPVGLRALTALSWTWGNPGYSASIRYLQQVERIFRTTQGAVLECGSGATTLLLGLLAEKQDRHVWTFEHHGAWCRHMQQSLRRFQLNRVQVCHAPLKEYNGFEWYRLPNRPLPHDFGMVVCDGPPGDIRGGRYGLLPVMQPWLRADCRILLDDTFRSREKALIQRWRREHLLAPTPLGTLGTCTELAFA